MLDSESHSAETTHRCLHTSWSSHKSSTQTHTWHSSGCWHNGCWSTHSHTHAHSWEHEVHVHIEGSVHLFLGFLAFFLFDVFCTLLNCFDTRAQVFDELYKIGHYIFLKTLSPCHLQGNIRFNKLVTSV